MTHRLFVGVGVLLGAIVFPWWIALGFSIYGTLRFRWFIEALCAGVLIDLMYGTHNLFGIPGIATLVSLILIVLMTYIRTYIRYEILVP